MTRPAPPRASAHRRTGYHIWLLVLLVHVTGVAAIFWLANHPGNVLLQVAHVPETAMLKAQWLGASGMKTDSPHNRITKSAASTSVSLPRAPTRKPVRAEAIPSTVAIKPDRSLSRTRSLSQLITSFIVSVSLGIHHTPFLTFFRQHDNNVMKLLILSAVK